MRNFSSLATSGRTLVAPSMISSDLSRVKDEVQALEAAGADWLHLDVMDGDFVPNITIGICIVEAIKRVSSLPLDCHLMIQKPERFASAFVKAGGASVSVHPEAQGDYRKALEEIRAAGGSPALALKPATPVSAAESVAELLDMLLIMTVNPGFSGQKMIVWIACRKFAGSAREIRSGFAAGNRRRSGGAQCRAGPGVGRTGAGGGDGGLRLTRLRRGDQGAARLIIQAYVPVIEHLTVGWRTGVPGRVGDLRIHRGALCLEYIRAFSAVAIQLLHHRYLGAEHRAAAGVLHSALAGTRRFIFAAG